MRHRSVASSARHRTLPPACRDWRSRTRSSSLTQLAGRSADCSSSPTSGRKTRRLRQPQRAWRVLGESGEVSRFEALRSGQTPLVGRAEELELLLRRWEQVKSGEGRVVLISGEPGIGKSRLTAAFYEHIAGQPHTRLRHFCSPHHQDSALYPYIAQLERAAGFARDDSVQGKLGKLWALLTPGSRDDDDIELLSELLSLPSSAADSTLAPSEKGRSCSRRSSASLKRRRGKGRCDPL